VKSRRFGKGTIHHGAGLEQVLTSLRVEPDVRVEGGAKFPCAAAGGGKVSIGDRGGIVFQHRRLPDREIYFIANTSTTPVDFPVSFRCAGRKPSFWNADTGRITMAAAFTQTNGRTHIPLHLAPSESTFVVFGEMIGAEVAGAAASNKPASETIATLEGPWTVSFNGQGAPAETVFETLGDWAAHPDDAIRHYSGTAIYQKSFTLPEPVRGTRTVLALGKVADIATIEVNGRTAGTAWTTPWAIDITAAVRSGENTIRIHVTNSWHNRLVDDAKRPENERQSYVSQPYRDAGSVLRPGGLLGPVLIKRVR
jgi:hypothetical protein